MKETTMTKKTNLEIVIEKVKAVEGELTRVIKNEILQSIKEELKVSPNNASVYLSKAIKLVAKEKEVVNA
jgi:hypothetical protein